jgi:phage/plasmid-associated DNA primase
MNRHDSAVRATAIRLNQLDIGWLVYARRSKDPHRNGWQKEVSPPLSAATDDRNIGIQLRDGLTDVDLDTMEAVCAAPFYLPASGMVFGRPSKPRSHHVYLLEPGESIPQGSRKYKDPTPPKDAKATLLELRVAGQTVAPGSIHEGTAELIDWSDDDWNGPEKSKAEALVFAARRIAAVALVARHWSDGTRHDLALPLSGLLWHGRMPLDQAETFMRAVCAAGEDDDAENRLGCLRDTYANGSKGIPITGGPTLEDYLTDAQVKRLREWLNLTSQRQANMLGPDGYTLANDGDGERFAEMWTGQVLYCAMEGQWYIYDGVKWERDEVQDIRERAKAVVTNFRRVLGERNSICGQNGTASYEVCSLYARKMGNAKEITAMLVSAQSRPELRIAPEEFDSRTLMLNALNCTLDLDTKTGTVRTHLHEPTDKLSMASAAEYVEGATHPLFDEFLTRFYPEPERRDFLQLLAGYALTGQGKRHSLQLIGPTNAGKSMTLSLFEGMMGDYGAALKYESLMKNPHRGGDVPRPDLWRVRKKRLVTISEVPPDARFDEALVKALLGGGDKVNIRSLFDKDGGRDIEWALTLWLSGNKPYGVTSGDEAAQERMLPLKCDHQVPKDERDQQKQLETIDPAVTGSAVLAWAVEGFKRLYGEKQGRLIPPEIVLATRVEIQDALDKWTPVVEELFEFTGNTDDGVLKSEAWTTARDYYTAVLEGRLGKPMREQSEFEDGMIRRGASITHAPNRYSNRNYWRGVRWTKTALKQWGATRPDWNLESDELRT